MSTTAKQHNIQLKNKICLAQIMKNSGFGEKRFQPDYVSCHALPSAVLTVSGQQSCLDLLAGSWGLVPLLESIADLSGLAAAPALPLEERK